VRETHHLLSPYGYWCVSRTLRLRLHDALLEHRVGDLDEAGDVGALDVVGVGAVLAVEDAVLVDGAHDLAELAIDFFAGAAHAAGVLGHFEPGNGHAAGVGGLARPEEGFGFEEDVDGLGGAGHVGPFADADTAV